LKLDAVCAGDGRVAVEVLESEAFSSPASERKVRHALERASVPVLLDDVGQGYSDAHRLTWWPGAGAKLDAASIEVLRVDPGRFARSLRELAHGRPEVVVEGVETDADADALAAVAAGLAATVVWGQGYAYGRPVVWEPLVQAGARR